MYGHDPFLVASLKAKNTDFKTASSPPLLVYSQKEARYSAYAVSPLLICPQKKPVT